MNINKNREQNFLIALLWLVYTTAYLGRYSYNSNISLIIDQYGITKATAGMVATFFFFAYGVGQAVNGILSKRYNKKFLFPLVLFISAIINIIAVSNVNFYLIKYLWLVNGFVQSCLWSSIVNVASNNLDSKHMNKAIVVLSTTASAGTLLSYGASSIFVWLGNYKLSFIVGACLMIFVGFVWLLLYKPTNIVLDNQSTDDSTTHSSTIGLALVFMLIVLGIFSVFDNFIKDGINTWFPKILKDQFKLHDSFSILLTLVLPILGIFGAMLAVWMNKFIKDFVTLTVTLFVLAGVFTCIIILTHASNLALLIICFGIVSLIMHGINNITTSMGPLKMRDRVDSGKVAGILNACCYLGSTISSFGLGAIADKGGWNLVFTVLLVSSIASVLIGFVYLIITKIVKIRN